MAKSRAAEPRSTSFIQVFDQALPCYAVVLVVGFAPLLQSG
ncbi:MAG TPA: hypothetical protein VF040_07140 [Ktedonobacterales bacterium]